MIPTIADIVCAGTARFVCFENNRLWYSVNYTDEQGEVHRNWQFYVPAGDTPGRIFLAADKPMMFMPWIRSRIMELREQEKPLTAPGSDLPAPLMRPSDPGRSF